MYNSYNIAFNYLKDKYGYKRSGLTQKKLEEAYRQTNKKQRLEFNKNLTNDDYILIINKVTEPIDKLILTLMGQCSYGIQAKKELSLLLFNLNITDKVM
jgi:hypothetical protein